MDNLEFITLKMTEIKIDRYTYKNGFYVDIITTKDKFEAWIGHEKYGISALLYGMPKKQINGEISYEEFLMYAKNGIENDIEYFREEYMDEDEYEGE